MTETSGPARTAMPERVLVGVDGSQHSLRALDRAVDEATLRGARLEVLCGGGTPSRRSVVPETDTDRERARRAAQEVSDAAAERARSRAPELVVISSPDHRPAADALVRASRNATLTVVGTRGHGGFRGLLLGSVSLRLAAHATGPLLVVRDRESGEEGGSGETVVGLKWRGTEGPLTFGFEQAARDGSLLRVVHSWTHPVRAALALKQPPKESSEEDKQTAAFLREAVEPFQERFPDVRLTTEPHRGPAAEHLIELSREARTVVLGVRREQRRLGLQVGPTVHSVLQHASSSVALVPVG